MFFLKNDIFLVSLKPPNSSIEIISYHRLSYVKDKHFRQAIFSYKSLLFFILFHLFISSLKV